jgi:hypothetical protein
VSLIEDPDVIIYLRGVTSVIGQGVKAGTTNVMISINDQTGSYVGTGNGQVQVTLNTGDPPNADLIESVGPLDGIVTYTYKPRTLAAIPETPTWAAMLVGFASLSFAGARAKRKGRGSNGVSRAHWAWKAHPPAEASWPRAHVYGLSVFRSCEHVFERFRRYVHRAAERVVQGNDDNQAGRKDDRQNRGHREVRHRIGTAEE